MSEAVDRVPYSWWCAHPECANPLLVAGVMVHLHWCSGAFTLGSWCIYPEGADPLLVAGVVVGPVRTFLGLLAGLRQMHPPQHARLVGG